MSRAGRLAICASACALAGCNMVQSPLDPAGPQARALADLFWLFTLLLSAIWLAVMIALALSLRSRQPADADPLAPQPGADRWRVAVVAFLTVLTGATVLLLTGISYATQKRLFSEKPGEVAIRITGHQWWWEIQYDNPDPSQSFTTANEIHVPVGKPIKLKLQSADVIHSFWVPSLTGKQDLIPGRENELSFTVERPGVYRGQCAEFCGLQHAHMGLTVLAEPSENFERWRQDQIKAAEPPGEDERQKGLQAFLSKPCVMCHTVRGTPAGGKVAPELTHLASRRTIAAGALPMSRGNLAAWIVDPQGIKPGANMPLMKLEPDELNSIVSFLEGLK